MERLKGAEAAAREVRAIASPQVRPGGRSRTEGLAAGARAAAPVRSPADDQFDAAALDGPVDALDGEVLPEEEASRFGERLETATGHARRAIARQRRGPNAQTTSNEIVADIPAVDVMVEQMAHRMAYLPSWSDAERALLVRWGYEPEPYIAKGRAGLTQLMGFIPAKDSKAPAVLAFPGTITRNLAGATSDAIAAVGREVMTKGLDADVVGTMARAAKGASADLKNLLADTETEIGRLAFERNKALIGATLAMLSPAIVAGHSLGGALAQLCAAEWPGQVSRVVTFNSPGVDLDTVNKFADLDKRPRVTHHRADNDVASLAGESHLAGRVYEHHVRDDMNPLTAHSADLLLSPQFQAQRAALGLDEQTLIHMHRQHTNDPKALAARITARAEAHLLQRSDLDPSARDIRVERLRREFSEGDFRDRLVQLVRLLDGGQKK